MVENRFAKLQRTGGEEDCEENGSESKMVVVLSIFSTDVHLNPYRGREREGEGRRERKERNSSIHSFPKGYKCSN